MTNNIQILDIGGERKTAYVFNYFSSIVCLCVSCMLYMKNINLYLVSLIVFIAALYHLLMIYAWLIRKQYIRLDEYGITVNDLFESRYFDWKYIQEVKYFKFKDNERIGFVFKHDYVGKKMLFENKYGFLKQCSGPELSYDELLDIGYVLPEGSYGQGYDGLVKLLKKYIIL